MTTTQSVQHVNFLEHRHPFIFNYLVMLSVLLGCLVVLSVIVSIQRLQVRFLQNQTSALKTEVTQLQEKQKDLISTSSLIPMQAIEEAIFQRRKWTPAIHEISRQIPDGVWLTSIAANLPDTLELQGVSWNIRPITAFQENLGRNRLFEEVVLVSSQKEGQSKGEGNSVQLNFTLKCRVHSL